MTWNLAKLRHRPKPNKKLINMILYPDNAVVMAPLSGYTDLPYRRSLRRYDCYYAFTEMIDAGSLAYNNPNAAKMLTRGDDEPWLAVQLLGADVEMLKKATLKLNQYNFDLLDFNLGCPVAKVTKKGAGAMLGRNIDQAAELLAMVVKLSRFPVTVKTRIFSETEVESTIKLAQALENAGAQTLTLHGRVKEKFYSGDVFYDTIAAVREAIKIPTIVNGGINSRYTYENALSQSGCNAAMIARGAMGNPWLFDEIQNPQFIPPTVDALADETERHVEEMLEFHGEASGFKLARKIILDYLRGRGYSGELRAKISFLNNRQDLLEIISVIRNGPSERYWQNVSHERQLTR